MNGPLGLLLTSDRSERQKFHREDWPKPYDKLVRGRVWRRDDTKPGASSIGLSCATRLLGPRQPIGPLDLARQRPRLCP